MFTPPYVPNVCRFSMKIFLLAVVTPNVKKLHVAQVNKFKVLKKLVQLV